MKPYIEELPELFVSYFKEILRVGYQIPRLEYYMSNGESVCMYVCVYGVLCVIDKNDYKAQQQ